MNCPCCSQISYANCCEKYHLNTALPKTPEQLMRSRYSAYALHLIDYLVETTYPLNRHLYPKKDLTIWAKANKWLGLGICNAVNDTVEFKAYYQNGLQSLVHHELSVFKLLNNKWYYYNGSYP